MNTRIVLVAGASSAAGRATCTALRASGATVIAVGSNAERLATVDADHSYVCDLADLAAVTALAEQVREEVGSIDGLLHLVGGWRGGRSDEDWQWLSTQLITTLRATSIAFESQLAASDAGRFAIVSSTAVDRPTWGNANYAAAKAAAESWVGALASSWKKAATAAAVTYVVRSLGDGEGDTSATVLATRLTALWQHPARELNGARISLVPGSDEAQERMAP